MTSTTASHTRIPAGIPAGIAAGIPATCPDVTSTNAESSDDPAGIGVAVVVAAFERPVELQILVDSLAAQTRRPDEVIVVDDGSATPLAPRFPTDDETEWTLLRQPNGGPGAARDHGIRAAHSEIIVILDDDMVADAELVAAHVAAHLDGAEVVQGRFHNADPASRPLFDRFIDDNLQRYFDDCADDPTAVDPARLATGNMSMRRAAYLAVDGFATDLDRREDADLGLRLASIGARFGFADRAVSIHDEPAEPLGRWLTVARQYGEAETELAERHASHSIDRVRDDMPGPIRAALTLGRRTPKLLAVSGRLAASAAVLAERTGLRSVALRGYGGAYALSWVAGVYTPTPPSASDRVHPPVSDQGHHRVHIGHAGIDAIGFDAAIDRIIEAADGDATFSVVTPNVDHLVLLERDEEFRAAYRCAGLVLADGQPIVLASRLLGLPL
ncbi:MAG: glycosyltransferase, partial [Actinomycetota bacterium]